MGSIESNRGHANQNSKSYRDSSVENREWNSYDSTTDNRGQEGQSCLKCSQIFLLWDRTSDTECVAARAPSVLGILPFTAATAV